MFGLSLFVIVGICLAIGLTTENKQKIFVEEKTITCNSPLGYKTPLPLQKYDKFAVVSDAKGCSTVGKDILQKNATIYDAAIAVALCLSVLNSPNTGLGGGLIMNAYIK